MCVTWHGIKALWKRRSDMNHCSRCSGLVICFFFVRPYQLSKKKKKPNKHNVQALLNSFDKEKVGEVFVFFQAFNLISSHQILRHYRNRAMWSEDQTARVH